MQLTIGPPLLFALGIRLFLNAINPAHVSSTPDHLLEGVWQGILLHYAIRHMQPLLFPVGFGIVGKLLYDFSQAADTTKLACCLLGAALGVLGADVLTQLFEDGRYNEKEKDRKVRRQRSRSDAAETQVSYEPAGRRLRLVSFGRSTAVASVEPSRYHQRARSASQAEVIRAASPSSHLTGDTITSIPSSLASASVTPAERAIAVLRARASLADSERRRFKEERKWALSQGNVARAEQLGWQVKRYSELMKSFNREADARLLDADRARQVQIQTSPPVLSIPVAPPPVPVTAPFPVQVPFPGAGTGTRHATITHQPPMAASIPVQSNLHYIPSATPAVTALHHDPHPQYTHVPQHAAQGQNREAPLVSVTVAGGPSRQRKRSGGNGVLKPAIYVHHGRETTMRR